jgi:fatty acid desaturase
MFSVLGLGVVVILVCSSYPSLVCLFVFFVLLMSTPILALTFFPLVPHHRRLGVHQRRMARFATCTVYLGWGERYATEEVGEEGVV